MKRIHKKPVLITLMIFFTLQLLSHLLLKLGEPGIGQTGTQTGTHQTGTEGTAGKVRFCRWGARLMPFDAESICEYGYALLLENAASKNNDTLLKSIAAFEKTIQYNVLFYTGYYYLGKALFLCGRLDSFKFEQGVIAFKRAALIRGNKDSHIAGDTLKLLLSLWPLLNNEDQTFGRKLLEKSINNLNDQDFNSLVELWGLYSRDRDFFKGIVTNNSRCSSNFARKIEEIQKLAKVIDGETTVSKN